MLSSIITNSREKCGGCSKNILTHNPISICDCCSKPTHAKCASKYLHYDNINDKWTCDDCLTNAPKRYNPFESHANNYKNGPEPVDDSDELIQISNILNSCQLYSSEQLNCIRKD